IAGSHADPDGMMSDSGEPHRSQAATLRAVRLPAKLARHNFGLQIGRNSMGGLRKDARFRGCGWLQKLLDDPLIHVQLGVQAAEAQQLMDGLQPFARGEDFRIASPFLRRENAEPYALDLGARRPECKEIFQIAFAFHHLAGYGAVDADVMTADIFEDPVIGGRPPANVVLGLEAINGYNKVEPGNARPFLGDFPNGTGKQLDMDSAPGQKRQQDAQLAKSHQGITTDERKV